jgi:hypothetical protein
VFQLPFRGNRFGRGLAAIHRQVFPPDYEEFDGRQFARRKISGFGARRLIQQFALPLGHNAVQRIINRHHLTRPPKRRHRPKNDLRAVKAAYAPFTRFQIDVKYLTDIPFYWLQMQNNGLPRFQYTLRELSGGAQFLVYSNELSKTYATLAVERFLHHLQQHGLATHQVVLTTDLGSEFDGDTVITAPKASTS